MTQAAGQTIGIIADDLTGTNDAVLPFFNVGCDTQVVFDSSQLTQWDSPTVQAWAVNTQSRHLPPREAAMRVREAALHMQAVMGVDVFYKKIDSTLRGPVGAECIALLDALNADGMIIAPSYPGYRRRLAGGYLLLEGIPVEQTAVARDPRAPVRQSHLPTLLQQQVAKPEWVGHISLSTILHGAGPIHTEITEQINAGKRLIVLDACSDTDMEQIALAVQTGRRVLNLVPCGSAGLAKALSRYWQQPDTPPAWMSQLSPPPVAEATLIVVGSTTDSCRKQLQTMELMNPDVPQHVVPPEVLLDLTPADAFVTLLATELTQHAAVVLSSQSVLTETLALAESHAIADPSERVERTLAHIVQRVLAQRPANLLLTGGETAYHCCRELNLTHWELWHEVEPSVVLGWAGHQWMGIKPGHFGSNSVFSHMLKWLEKQH
jgi:D-threonate/D-erythronate kinase